MSDRASVQLEGWVVRLSDGSQEQSWVASIASRADAERRVIDAPGALANPTVESEAANAGDFGTVRITAMDEVVQWKGK